MDHRPSPNEITRIEKQAKKQSQNELDASQEVQNFMEHTTPQRKEYLSKQNDFTKH